MKREQKYFLSIIKDYIGGIKTEPDNNIDWQEIFNYSKSHQLSSIIYHQCKGFIPQENIEAFSKANVSNIYSNTNRRNLTNDTLLTLKNNGINCFLIKGFDIADFYPNWQFRSMGDTDIVVDDLEKAHDILIRKGFKNLSKNQDREYQYLKYNMEFELHDRLVYDEAINLDITTDYLNNFKDFVINDRLDDSFHFIFIINHLRKHFMNRGVGFRQFVDIAFLIKNDNKINWNLIQEQLDSIGLLEFSKTVFYYIEKWFGVVAPINSKIVPDVIFEESTTYVFDNGVFGFNNEENNDYLASNTVRKSKFLKFSMLKSAMNKVFPSYKTLCSSDTYSFLKNKPILLPYAWIYRITRGIKRKRIQEGKKLILDSFVSKEYIAKREEMFRNWGLK